MIQVRFSTRNNLFSRFIRWWTNGDYSHFEFVLPDGRVLGSEFFGGVDVRDAGKYYDFEDFHVDAPDIVYWHAMLQVGKAYDYKSIFGLFFRRDWQKTDAWNCSELGAWCFAVVGYPLLRCQHMNRITPTHLTMSTKLIEKVK